MTQQDPPAEVADLGDGDLSADLAAAAAYGDRTARLCEGAAPERLLAEIRQLATEAERLRRALQRRRVVVLRYPVTWDDMQLRDVCATLAESGCRVLPLPFPAEVVDVQAVRDVEAIVAAALARAAAAGT